MIDFVERGLRYARRTLSRSRWLGRLHDAAGVPVAPSAAPGLLIIQIDGLSANRLRSALAAGRMPFVARLVASGELRLVPFYTGLPSTTPAVQAELFYGIEAAVPAFTFVDHATGRLMRMYQSAAPTPSCGRATCAVQASPCSMALGATRRHRDRGTACGS